jgi:hypothetical protein
MKVILGNYYNCPALIVKVKSLGVEPNLGLLTREDPALWALLSIYRPSMGLFGRLSAHGKAAYYTGQPKHRIIAGNHSYLEQFSNP